MYLTSSKNDLAFDLKNVTSNRVEWTLNNCQYIEESDWNLHISHTFYNRSNSVFIFIDLLKKLCPKREATVKCTKCTQVIFMNSKVNTKCTMNIHERKREYKKCQWIFIKNNSVFIKARVSNAVKKNENGWNAHNCLIIIIIIIKSVMYYQNWLWC